MLLSIQSGNLLRERWDFEELHPARTAETCSEPGVGSTIPWWAGEGTRRWLVEFGETTPPAD
jgi:hypothetical protein